MMSIDKDKWLNIWRVNNGLEPLPLPAIGAKTEDYIDPTAIVPGNTAATTLESSAITDSVSVSKVDNTNVSNEGYQTTNEMTEVINFFEQNFGDCHLSVAEVFTMPFADVIRIVKSRTQSGS
jgi:hypothetical protein